MTSDEIDNVFIYHAPFGDQPERCDRLRQAARGLAHLIYNDTPPSREQSLALTKLQEAFMFASAAIAVNETREGNPWKPPADTEDAHE